MLWAPSFQGPRSPWVSLPFRAEDLFFFFLFFFFACRFFPQGRMQDLTNGGGGRRCKHWSPGAGDPRYATVSIPTCLPLGREGWVGGWWVGRAGVFLGITLPGRELPFAGCWLTLRHGYRSSSTIPKTALVTGLEIIQPHREREAKPV